MHRLLLSFLFLGFSLSLLGCNEVPKPTGSKPAPSRLKKPAPEDGPRK